jgi:hypothetical protein
MCVYIYARPSLRTCIRACVYICANVLMWNLYVCVCIYMYIYVDRCPLQLTQWVASILVRRKCTQTHTHTHVRTYTQYTHNNLRNELHVSWSGENPRDFILAKTWEWKCEYVNVYVEQKYGRLLLMPYTIIYIYIYIYIYTHMCTYIY